MDAPDLEAVVRAVAQLPPVRPLRAGESAPNAWRLQERLAATGTWIAGVARGEAAWNACTDPLAASNGLDAAARQFPASGLATIRIPVPSWVVATRLQRLTTGDRPLSDAPTALPALVFDCVRFECAAGRALCVLQCRLVRAVAHLALRRGRADDLFAALARTGDWITASVLEAPPRLSELIVELHRVLGAIRAPSSTESGIGATLATAGEAAWQQLVAALDAERNIRVTPAAQARRRVDRVSFAGESRPASTPQVELHGDEPVLLQAAVQTHVLPAPTQAWADLGRLGTSANRRFHVVARGALEARALQQAGRGRPGLPAAVRRAAIASARLVDGCDRAAGDAVRAFVREHLGIRLHPVADVVSDEDEGVVNWSASAVHSGAEARGTVLGVSRTGASADGEVVRRAVVVLGAGPTDRLDVCSSAWRSAAASAPWVAPLSMLAVDEWDALSRTQAKASSDFLQFGDRVQAAARRQLQRLERSFEGHVQRAIDVAPLHRVLMAIAAPGHWEQMIEEAAATCHAYVDGTQSGDVVGCLASGLSTDDTATVVRSRGASAPAWLVRRREALRFEGVWGAQRAALARELERAVTHDPAFGSEAWRHDTLLAWVRVGDFRSSASVACLQLLTAEADNLPDLALWPDPSDPHGNRGTQVREGFDVRTQFCDGTRDGDVLSVARVGCRVGTSWIQRPRATLSAGPHRGRTRVVERAVRSFQTWLGDPATDVPSRTRERLITDVQAHVVAPLYTAPAGPQVDAHLRALLLAPGGLLACVSASGCLDVAVARQLRAAVCALRIPITVGQSSLLRSNAGEADEPVALLPQERDGEPYVLEVRGGAPDPTAMDVALKLMAVIAKLPDVNPVAEEEPVRQTIANLQRDDVDQIGCLAALQSRVYGLQVRASPRHSLPLHALVLDCIDLLDRVGVQTIELNRGVDARLHESRFHVSPGARRWRVTTVRRPCLLQDGRVVQIGIVDTD